MGPHAGPVPQQQPGSAGGAGGRRLDRYGVRRVDVAAARCRAGCAGAGLAGEQGGEPAGDRGHADAERPAAGRARRIGDQVLKRQSVPAVTGPAWVGAAQPSRSAVAVAQGAPVRRSKFPDSSSSASHGGAPVKDPSVATLGSSIDARRAPTSATRSGATSAARSGPPAFHVSRKPTVDATSAASSSPIRSGTPPRPPNRSSAVMPVTIRADRVANRMLARSARAVERDGRAAATQVGDGPLHQNSEVQLAPGSGSAQTVRATPSVSGSRQGRASSPSAAPESPPEAPPGPSPPMTPRTALTSDATAPEASASSGPPASAEQQPAERRQHRGVAGAVRGQHPLVVAGDRGDRVGQQVGQRGERNRPGRLAGWRDQPQQHPDRQLRRAEPAEQVVGDVAERGLPDVGQRLGRGQVQHGVACGRRW